jgi:polar amino acid transport system ATP-binding protein
MKLAVESARKIYDTKVVLDDVDLTVDTHEVVCLIGASGSGKSTLLKAINLHVLLDAGHIFFDGEDITAPGVNANQVRTRMGIVFQSFNLFPHMRVVDNVTLGPRRAGGMERVEAEHKARRLLDRFGLGEKADDYPDRLSGGQQQRVAIIRALAMEPTLLLLDEITSALDPVLVGEVLSVLRELKSSGMTMVLATHEMGFARDTADRVVFLHQGR